MDFLRGTKDEGSVTVVPLDESDLSSVPAVVERISFDGVARTKDDVLRKECDRIFQASNFEELLVNVDYTIKEFQRLGVVSAIGALIDVGKNDENYQVSFFVKEPNRLFGAVQTTVSGSGDTGLNLSIETPNFAGAGERCRIEQGFGTKTKSHFSFSLAKPIQLSAAKSISSSLFRRNFLFDASGLHNVDHGLSVDLRSQLAPFIHHRLGWEGSWRFAQSTNPKTPYDVRILTGHSLKSAVINEIVNDTRDHPMLAENGHLLKFTHELAGLGGDVQHSKQEAHLQLNLPLFAGMSLQGTFGAGFVAPLQNNIAVGIADRYFLGGLNLRGFLQNHAGPHSRGFSTGGVAFWTSGLHLYTPLPFTDPYQPLLRHIRLHGFVNVGNVSNTGALRELVFEFPYSVGGGIVFALGRLARLEINFTQVLRGPADYLRSGALSFGFGVSHS